MALTAAQQAAKEKASLDHDVREFRQGNYGFSYKRTMEIKAQIAAQNAPQTANGIKLAKPGIAGRTVSDVLRGKSSIPLSQLSPGQQRQIQIARLNEQARKGSLTKSQYDTKLNQVERGVEKVAAERTVQRAQAAAPGLRAAATAERERFANLSTTNIAAQEQAQTKQLQKVAADVKKAGVDPARLQKAQGRPNPRSDMKITTLAEQQQRESARQQVSRTVKSASPKSFDVSLNETLGISSQIRKSKTSQNKKPVPVNTASFIRGSEAIVNNPVFQNILKSSNISLKGEMSKVAQRRKKVSLDDALFVPGTISYATSKEKEPLLLRPYERRLDPLSSPADLIASLSRPVRNLGQYLAAVPEGFKQSFEKGDFFAGEKYYEEQVAPKMKKTAESRLFSGDWKNLFDPERLPENILSATTSIGMYAFLGGRGRAGGETPKPFTSTPLSLGKGTGVQPSLTLRNIPQNIFKSDQAIPSQFKETKIELGKGIGLKFDPSSGGVTVGKTGPPGKPPSTFTSTKTSLGKGMGKPPSSFTVTKDGQILEQILKPQQAKATYIKLGTGKGQLVSTKPKSFQKTTVKLGPGEAKIMKQIQNLQKKTPVPSTKKSKKPISQTGTYVMPQEFKQTPKLTPKLSSILTPKQQQGFKLTPKLTPKLKSELSSILTPKQPLKTKQTPRPRQTAVPFVPVIPVTQTTTFTPPPPRTPTPTSRGFVFPPYFPRTYFGSGGFESPGSTKKSFATYGISSDINIKTLPTYSRYSPGTNIFKAQRSEDEMIQNLFYGKPKKKSSTKKSSKSKSKSKSKKKTKRK